MTDKADQLSNEPLDVLREMFQLVTDDILVRNIERDSLTGEYLRNASRLVMVLKRAETLLTKPTASVPTLTNEAELAELLNLLMATNVHGAILQLRDHLDGDKRLLDNYQRLYKLSSKHSYSAENPTGKFAPKFSIRN